MITNDMRIITRTTTSASPSSSHCHRPSYLILVVFRDSNLQLRDIGVSGNCAPSGEDAEVHLHGFPDLLGRGANTHGFRVLGLGV